MCRWVGVGFLLLGVNEPLLSLFCLYFVVDFSVYCCFFFVFCFCFYQSKNQPNKQQEQKRITIAQKFTMQ